MNIMHFQNHVFSFSQLGLFLLCIFKHFDRIKSLLNVGYFDPIVGSGYQICHLCFMEVNSISREDYLWKQYIIAGLF